jgi:hypothetical protein
VVLLDVALGQKDIKRMHLEGAGSSNF